MKKIILFDIDGTLIDCMHGQDCISEKTKKALKRLKEAGYYLFIASGRPYCYITKDIKSFEFDGYILDDGAYVLYQNKELSYHPINIDDLKLIIKQSQEKNRACIAYTKKKAYLFNVDQELINYCHSFKFQDEYIDYVDDIKDIQNDILKLHVQSRNEKDFHDMDIDQTKFYSANDHEYFLNEIYGRKYTTATALLEVLKELDILVENSYFFGDGLNDIEMLDAIGHPIVMGNARDEVKSHGEYICKSVSEDGVADFIENSNLFFNK